MNSFESRLMTLCRTIEEREQMLLDNLLRLKRLRIALTDLADPNQVTVQQLAQAYRHWREVIDMLPFAAIIVEVRDVLDEAHAYWRDIADTVAERSRQIVAQILTDEKGAST